jgi:hypothetical protein
MSSRATSVVNLGPREADLESRVSSVVDLAEPEQVEDPQEPVSYTHLRAHET